MAFGAEVATAYVRIRPQMAGFEEQATGGIKAALSGIQGEIDSYTAAAVASARDEVTANEELAASFRRIGLAAEEGSKEAQVAFKLAQESAMRAADGLGASFARVPEQAGVAGREAGSALAEGIGASAARIGEQASVAGRRAGVAAQRGLGASYAQMSAEAGAAGRRAGSALSAGVGSSAAQIGAETGAVGRRAGAALGAGLESGLGAAYTGLTERAGVAGREAGTALGRGLGGTYAAIGAQAGAAGREASAALGAGLESGLGTSFAGLGVRAGAAGREAGVALGEGLGGTYAQIGAEAGAAGREAGTALGAGLGTGLGASYAGLDEQAGAAGRAAGAALATGLDASYAGIAAQAGAAGRDAGASLAAGLGAAYGGIDAEAGAAGRRAGAALVTGLGSAYAGVEAAAAAVGRRAGAALVSGLTASYAAMDAEAGAAGHRAGSALAAGLKSSYARIDEQAGSAGRQAGTAVQRGLGGTYARMDAQAAAAGRRAGAALAEGVGASFNGIDERAGAAGRRAGDALGAGIAAGAKKGTAVAGTGMLAGLRSKFLNVGTLLGVGFGAAIGIKFVKDVVNSAASAQKSEEVIRSEFGKSGEAIVRWAHTSGIALGIANDQALGTAAKFGILFHNLGLGQPLAARMAQQFEALVGSLASIRGVDPSTIMAKIALAAAGNTRGLKQMGIVVDTASEKLEFFKQTGLHVQGSLSAAQKTIAIYGIATQHLGQFQAQAAKHSGDFVNVQRRLSAEWGYAKEIIGAALLPSFTKLVTALANWLDKMEKTGRLQKDVNGILRTTKGIFDAIRSAVNLVLPTFEKLIGKVGGAKTAFEGLLLAMAVNKLRSVATSIVTTLIQQGIAQIGPAAEGEAVAYGTSMTTMELATVGLGTVIKTTLISTGIGAIVIAIGIAAAYMITHWGQVKRYAEAAAKGIAATWTGLKDVLIGLAKIIGGAVSTALLTPLLLFLKAAKSVTGFLSFLPGVGHLHKAAAGALDFLEGITTKLMGGGLADVMKGGLEMARAFGKGWTKSLDESVVPDTKKIAKKAKKAIDDATTGGTGGTPGLTAAQLAAIAAQKAADAVFNQGVANAIANAKTKLARAIASGNQAIAAAQQTLDNFILSGTLRIQNSIKSMNDKIAAETKSMNDRIASMTTAMNTRLAAMQASLAKSLVKNSEDAVNNLTTLGGKLSTTLAGFFKTAGGANTTEMGAVTAQFARLRGMLGGTRASIASITNAAQTLASQISQSSGQNPATVAKQHIATLTDSFNKGHLGVRAFHEKLLAYLKSQGATYASIGKANGKGAADAFMAEIKALVSQADAIAKLPPKLRAKAEAASGLGLHLKVIDPLKLQAEGEAKIKSTRLTDEAKIKKVRLDDEAKIQTTRLRDEAHIQALRLSYQRELEQKLGNLSKVDKNVGVKENAARHAEAVTLHKEHLRTLAHIASDTKKGSIASRKTAVHTKQTAATNAAMSNHNVNGSAFRSSPSQNHGKVADSARGSSKGGLSSG